MAPASAVNKPSRLTSKRVAKRENILAIAAQLINELGPGSLRLGIVAKEVGISRNSLYYYVKDRGDLIHQSYLRTCKMVSEVICRVSVEEHDPANRIRRIVSELLNRNGRHLAVVSDAAMLEQSQRTDIDARVNRLVKELSELIDDGINVGAFRPNDSNVLAQMMLGMVFWTILWNRWISPNESTPSASLENASIAICDIILNGIAVQSTPEFKPSAQAESDFRSLMSADSKISDQDVPNKLKESASLLFNRHGIESVSLDEIAAATGFTKGAIYHHFDDKNALILASYERAFDIHNRIVDIAEGTTEWKVHQMLAVHYFNCRAQAEETPPLSIQPGVLLLPSALLNTASALADRMRNLHQEATKEGRMRTVDPSIAELTAGALVWIQNWRHSRKDLSGDSIAKIMTNVVENGILATRTKH